MPVSRDLARDLITDILELFAGLETRIVRTVASELERGMSSPDWAQDKAAALTVLRRRLQAILDRLDADTGDMVTQALALAFHAGGVEALSEVARLNLSPLEELALNNPAMERLSRVAGLRRQALTDEMNFLRRVIPGLDAIMRMAWTLTSRLRGTHAPILRWVDDAYRDTVARTGLVPVLAGVQTRRRAAQVTWERFLTQGITGFRDRSGRRWELASYVEMATRTGVAQAAVEGHLDRLAAAGIDLVIVSNAPQECVLCRPWEGKVLTRSGPTGRVTAENPITEAPVAVDVAGTVTQAITAGLMHPNCRHSLNAFLPGITRIPGHTADPVGDANRQRLRAMERTVRKWKLREAGALTPEAQAKARAKVRDWQSRIREHVAATGLHRQRPREQIGAAR